MNRKPTHVMLVLRSWLRLPLPTVDSAAASKTGFVVIVVLHAAAPCLPTVKCSAIDDSSVPYSSALPSNVSVVGCSKHGLWLLLMQDGRGRSEGPDNVVSSLADCREVRSAAIHPDGVLQYPVRNGQVPFLHPWACVVHAPRLVS
jgi:hypothetical protein